PVIKELLGADYRGVAGTDRSAGYAWRDVASRQVCWAPLQRDFLGLVDRGGAAQAVGTGAVALLHPLLTVWQQFRAGARDRDGAHAAGGAHFVERLLTVTATGHQQHLSKRPTRIWLTTSAC